MIFFQNYARRIWLLLPSLLIWLACLCSGQQPTPQRDEAAIATLQTAVNALGGQAAVNLISDSVLTGSATLPDGSGQLGSFTWKTLGFEFRYEFQSATDQTIFVSGHGRPANSHNGVVAEQPIYVGLATPAVHLPSLIISRALADSEYSILAMGSVKLPSGQNANQVRTIANAYPLFTTATQQDWYFDPASGLPVSVAYCLPDKNDANSCVAGSMAFSDYRPSFGLLVPFRLVIGQDGIPSSAATLTEVSFNVGLSSSEFDLLAGGQ